MRDETEWKIDEKSGRDETGAFPSAEEMTGRDKARASPSRKITNAVSRGIWGYPSLGPSRSSMPYFWLEGSFWPFEGLPQTVFDPLGHFLCTVSKNKSC